MTDKHIPASKLLDLISNAVMADVGMEKISVIDAESIRALIDEAPEVSSEPVAKVLCIIDEDGELEPHTFYSNDEAPRQEELKNKFVIFDVWLSPPPSTDLTKLVGELVEELGEARHEVQNQASAARLLPYNPHKYEAYVTQLANIDALLTRAKEYLK